MSVVATQNTVRILLARGRSITYIAEATGLTRAQVHHLATAAGITAGARPAAGRLEDLLGQVQRESPPWVHNLAEAAVAAVDRLDSAVREAGPR